jgi:preprotein translocase subunit YajC
MNKEITVGDLIINERTGAIFGKVLDIKDEDVIIENNGVKAKLSKRIVQDIINK